MTTLSRLDQLLEFYREDPNDPFNVYALAIEYGNTDAQKARYYFEGLLKWHPNYLATYYQAGKFFQEQEEYEKALETFRLGQQLADALGNARTLDELKRAERMLIDEMEE